MNFRAKKSVDAAATGQIKVFKKTGSRNMALCCGTKLNK